MRAWDRLKFAYTKLRGVADVKPVIDSGNALGLSAPQAELERLAQMAALSCTALCRSAIKANMAAKGVDSKNLISAVDSSYAYFWLKRMIVRLRMPAKLKGWEHFVKKKNGKRYGPYKDKRPEGPYVMQASLDAGYVLSPAKIGARSKRRIKAGVANFKTTKAVDQVHLQGDGRWMRFTRGEINIALLTIKQGKHFWEFTPAQEKEIAERFEKNFFGLCRKYGYLKGA
jgi:hypothetical protein